MNAIIPENTVTQKDLEVWYELQNQLKKLRATEMLMRQRLFGHFFPKPVEGTNRTDIGGGFDLVGKHVINRKIDFPAFQTLVPKFREEGLQPEKLVEMKPNLVLKEYRELTEEQIFLFDQCLIIDEGSPALEICARAVPKEAKPKKEPAKRGRKKKGAIEPEAE